MGVGVCGVCVMYIQTTHVAKKNKHKAEPNPLKA